MSEKAKEIYQLRYSKEKGILKVSPLGQEFYHSTYINKDLAGKPDDYILFFGPGYCFSLSRSALVQAAKTMKQEWIEEAEETLEKYKKIKI